MTFSITPAVNPTDPNDQTPFDHTPWLALAVGNTRAKLALLRGDQVLHTHAALASDPDALGPLASDLVAKAGSPIAWIAVSSVADRRASDILARLAPIAPAAEHLWAGRDLDIPLEHRLEDASTLGRDRALNAIAAFRRARQACVVADAGTAIAIDFIDGRGAFCGGAIAPGLGTMLKALHLHTAALPDLPFQLPDPARGPFGLDTAHAMRTGITAAARGMLRELLDRYAEHYGAYPQVIATGGDAGVFEATGLVDHVVPNLQIMGLAACVRAAITGDDPLDFLDPADDDRPSQHHSQRPGPAGPLGLDPPDHDSDPDSDDDL